MKCYEDAKNFLAVQSASDWYQMMLKCKLAAIAPKASDKPTDFLSKVLTYIQLLYQNKDQTSWHKQVIDTFLTTMPIFYQLSIRNQAKNFTNGQQLTNAIAKAQSHKSGDRHCGAANLC
uniref:Uncharacterized protein n=1 Tax=Romanomermis culicivorax TaxID=13658 RepID=A0A915LAB7_ROMCU